MVGAGSEGGAGDWGGLVGVCIPLHVINVIEGSNNWRD